MEIIDTNDRGKVELIRVYSDKLVREGKAEETLNWDESSDWHNSKYKEVSTGKEWVVYLAERAWPGEVRLL